MYSGERIQSDRLSVDFDTMAGVYQPPDYGGPPGNGAGDAQGGGAQGNHEMMVQMPRQQQQTHFNNQQQIGNGTHNQNKKQKKVQPKLMRHLNGNGEGWREEPQGYEREILKCACIMMSEMMKSVYTGLLRPRNKHYSPLVFLQV